MTTFDETKRQPIQRYTEHYPAPQFPHYPLAIFLKGEQQEDGSWIIGANFPISNSNFFNGVVGRYAEWETGREAALQFAKAMIGESTYI
ncbi:hypothetical protein [Chitinolyticbacter meiyuanensis]|uniref:hypothetical protein n=1 Tax=Chitinolyticbacter meiyuanensis TaxID=682798 RepID=UPI0011E5ADDA|nr:hypothetical protein [Chitinolyticbacter meiyuanensis]